MTTWLTGELHIRELCPPGNREGNGPNRWLAQNCEGDRPNANSFPTGNQPQIIASNDAGV